MTATSANLAGNPASAPLQPWLLAATAALLVSRPLVPSEGVAWLGDGQPWVMLWLIVAALTLLSAVAQGKLAAPLRGIDFAVLALVVWHSIAALAALRTGSPRPAVNMLWEWVGMGASYFCVRQLACGRSAARALLAMMVSLAVGISALGYHQYFVTQPAQRAEYASDPEAVLARTGEWYPPDSPQLKRFEERLKSTEPLATFALTNSLAGFLVPWLIVAVALAVSAVGWRCGLLSAVIAGCLLLTHSRSGYVGAGVGLAALALLSPRGRQWFSGRRLVIVVAAAVLLAGGAVVASRLDGPVMNAAGKSMLYRIQYWRASWSMICDHPWLGCGPGNFQDEYMAYKLPEADEEVRDPHNFLIEIWATAGTPALLAMLAMLAGLTLRTFRSHQTPNTKHETQNTKHGIIAAGALAGLLLAYGVAPLVGMSFELDRLAIIGFGGIAAWLVLVAWMRGGELRPAWLAAALAAQCVHHLAAGGIGYPGVADSFWLLSALLISATEIGETEASRSPAKPLIPATPWQRMQPLLGLVAACVAAGCCYLTAYGPVLRCQALLNRAFQTPRVGTTNLLSTEAEQKLLAAAAADPLSDEPVRLLAENELARWRADRSPQSLRRFTAAAEAMLHLRPNSSFAWQRMGQWYREIHDLTHDPADAEKAAGYFQRAVQRYPNSAALNADWAEASSAAGQTDAARQAAAEACRLDASTPHVDKQLTAAQRARMQELAQGSR